MKYCVYCEFVMCQVAWNQNIDATRLHDGGWREIHTYLLRALVFLHVPSTAGSVPSTASTAAAACFPHFLGLGFGFGCGAGGSGTTGGLLISRMNDGRTRRSRCVSRYLRCVVMHSKTLHGSWDRVTRWSSSRGSNARDWGTRFTPLNIHWETLLHSKLKLCLPVVSWGVIFWNHCGWGAIREKCIIEEVEDITSPGVTTEEAFTIKVVVRKIRDARFVPSFFQKLSITGEDEYSLTN